MKMHPGCLHEIFEAQVDARPADVAVISRGINLTYREIEERSNRFARQLRAFHLQPNDFVALYLNRSEEAIIAILAVLKAGAAYIPLDPVYPEERVKHILTEADVKILVTEQALASRISPHFAGPRIVVDAKTHLDDVARHPAARLSREETGVTPEDLCYVIYTSGTTGRPKGIMTEHRNVAGFIESFRNVCGLIPSDRVYQGFSLGFDGSVEEMWMAFSSGAALVIGPPEIAKLGDETARYMARHGVTVFSTVPTFLGMMTEEIPSLRLIIVSGESCPGELVQRWAGPTRRMLNVYGPTETTVNATAWECVPGETVTIGRPLAGYETYILDETMRPVARHQAGELYIGGVGVARGYLNQPGMTAEHFVTCSHAGNDGAARLYRTGDLVREAENGDLLFLGRIDGQVKVRGYRIELGEIETVLCEHRAIRTAAVKVVHRNGLPQLAAFVVPACQDAPNLDREEILDLLCRRLPAYMVPSHLDVVDDLPRLTSGKVDRSSLPDPSSPLLRVSGPTIAPRTELERKLCDAWEEIFATAPVSIGDDFFLDLGGYSLLAVKLEILLREQHGITISMRDVYEHPTITTLAEHIASLPEETMKEPVPPVATDPRVAGSSGPAGKARFRWPVCVGLQCVSVLFLYGLMASPLLISLVIIRGIIQGRLDLAVGIGLMVALTLLWYPGLLLLSIGGKWLIVGRFRPGTYPVWGLYHFRLWLTTRLHTVSGIGLMAGTPVMSLYYRLMGAKIGRHCIIDTPFCTVFDLVSMGDETCIGAETQLLGYRIEGGMLRIDRIDIGSRCFVGIHSALGLDTRMEDDSCLGDLSLLPDGEVIPAGASRTGAPAVPGDVPLPEAMGAETALRHPFLFGIAYLLMAGLIEVFIFLTLAPSAALVALAYDRGGLWWSLATIFLTLPISVLSFCLMLAGLKAVVLRRTEPGTYRVESWLFLRKWFIDALMMVSRLYVRGVYTTIYLPALLRLLGARIGRRAEISTVSQVAPDLIEIDDESFFADGSMIGGRHFFRGHVQFGRNRIGRRSFVGNNAILPINHDLGGNCLLGVLSLPPDEHPTTPDGSEWLGSPSFRLPFRQKVECYDTSVTYTPTARLYAQRLVIDAIRVLTPPALVALGAIALASVGLWALDSLSPVVMPFVFAGAGLATAVGVALCVVLLKWVLMGRFEPVIKPLWCPYVWWNEMINGAYETVAVPMLAPLVGTPLFNWYLRCLGCRVGKRAYVGTTLFSEFDLVEIGDRAALNAGVVVQNHLFEDRIMKSSHIRIGDDCAAGNMAVVLYDTVMERGSSVGPLSLVMKGQVLPPATHWIGIPTHRASSTGGQAPSDSPARRGLARAASTV